MKKYLVGFSILLLWFSVLGQEYSINGTITGLENKEVYLMRISGDQRRVIDTAQTDLTGSFEFPLSADFPVGQYAVITGPGRLVELLFNRENIRFVTTGNSKDDQVQIIESIENMIYYDYLDIKGTNLYKLDLLNPVVQYYPEDDPFYDKTLAKVRLLQSQVSERAAELIENNPNTLSASVIRVDQPVFANPELSMEEQAAYLKAHYFSATDFQDTLLLNTNILTGKIIAYLTLYQKKGMSQEQLEEQLIMAVDTVLSKAFVEQTTYEFVVEFLIKGFEAIGFERGLEHIANQNMLSELCVNTEKKKALENRIELIRRLAIGKPAPDFSFTDMDGHASRLSEIQSEKTLLVFWASWCPHCEAILPVLKEYYDPDNTEKLEIVAVSIDENREAWKNAVKGLGFNWINVAELKGWDSEIGELYGLAATPTFFVLDRDKNII
ncbi:MAG: thioredoxin-like domain-containing protein, partial [bacterium]